MSSACVEDSLPLYLRPNDPACAVLESHVASTSNVVLKITVPKRTGRKRKRGTQDPFVGDENPVQVDRYDATTVFQSLQDNIDKYQIEPVGVVNATHRYRGLNFSSPILKLILMHVFKAWPISINPTSTALSLTDSASRFYHQIVSLPL